MLKEMRHLALAVLDFAIPPRCFVTGEPVAYQGAIAPHLWRELHFIAPPFCDQCGIPLAYGDHDVHKPQNLKCGRCLTEKPPFTKARSAIVYDDASKSMILSFKHGDRLQGAKPMAQWMMNAGRDILAECDVIIPVPLHRWRLLKRRYNQSALLAQAIAKKTGMLTILDGLIRVRSTPTQGHLSFKERHKNVANAFVANPKHIEKLKGKTVCLVDDVLTTGATISECCRVLLENGVHEVHILTMARVAKD